MEFETFFDVMSTWKNTRKNIPTLMHIKDNWIWEITKNAPGKSGYSNSHEHASHLNILQQQLQTCVL